MDALRRLGDKYNPGQDEALEAEIDKDFSHLHMIAIDVEHITGKEALELTKQRAHVE